MHAASKRGKLDVLRWAREHGCPWDMASTGTMCIRRHAFVRDPLLYEDEK